MSRYPEISAERLSRLFRLDHVTGHLYWVCPNKHHKEKVGTEAGFCRKQHNNKNYWIVKVDGHAYRRSQLVFCMTNSKWPDPCVDHINGNSLDDRPENLRAVTITQNAWNHKGRKKSSNLPMGVRAHKGTTKFQARISFNKKQINLGFYSTVKQAHRAYLNARQKFFGEYA